MSGTVIICGEPEREGGRATRDTASLPPRAAVAHIEHTERDFRRAIFDGHIRHIPINGPLRWILDHVDYPSDECALWPFSRTGDDYPLVVSGKWRKRAHRVMCELVNGPAPSGTHHCAHSCGNSLCVNPKHLRWATPQENSDDKFLHGTVLRGSQINRSKLTAQQVREIRSLHATGRWSFGALGRRYGIHYSNISAIIHRKKWGWLDD